MVEDKRQWTLEHSTKAKARTKDTNEKAKERTKEKATASMATTQVKDNDKYIQVDQEKDK